MMNERLGYPLNGGVEVERLGYRGVTIVIYAFGGGQFVRGYRWRHEDDADTTACDNLDLYPTIMQAKDEARKVADECFASGEYTEQRFGKQDDLNNSLPEDKRVKDLSTVDELTKSL